MVINAPMKVGIISVRYGYQLRKSNNNSLTVPFLIFMIVYMMKCLIERVEIIIAFAFEECDLVKFLTLNAHPSD